jgi:hypothetical protein
METLIPIHPYDMYDLLSECKLAELLAIECKEGPNGLSGPAMSKIRDKWYIEDTNAVYKGSNPEFLAFLKESGNQ